MHVGKQIRNHVRQHESTNRALSTSKPRPHGAMYEARDEDGGRVVYRQGLTHPRTLTEKPAKVETQQQRSSRSGWRASSKARSKHRMAQGRAARKHHSCTRPHTPMSSLMHAWKQIRYHIKQHQLTDRALRTSKAGVKGRRRDLFRVSTTQLTRTMHSVKGASAPREQRNALTPPCRAPTVVRPGSRDESSGRSGPAASDPP